MIPAAVGGGRPRPVQVFLKNEAAAGSPLAVFQTAASPGASPRHMLLFSTDKTYIIVDPVDPARALEIPKDLVVAVRTLSR